MDKILSIHENKAFVLSNLVSGSRYISIQLWLLKESTTASDDIGGYTAIDIFVYYKIRFKIRHYFNRSFVARSASWKLSKAMKLVIVVFVIFKPSVGNHDIVWVDTNHGHLYLNEWALYRITEF